MPDLDQSSSPAGRVDTLTLTAFGLAAIFAGGNAVAVRLGLSELPPFSGAAMRFLAAAALLGAAAGVMHLPWPHGRALTGTLLYGLLSFGLTYMLLYWALQEVTAATSMVALALVPLLTLILAVVQGVERFTVRALIGAVVAALGIGIVFADGIGAVSVLSLAALIGAALCIAEAGIVVKRYPKVHPVVQNGLGTAVGGVLLAVVSLLAGEPWLLPATPAVQISFAYLVLFGSVGLFGLYLFVLGRWTASATAYVLLLAPLSAAVLGLMVLGEGISPALALGGTIAVAGVYIGALWHPARRAPGDTAKA